MASNDTPKAASVDLSRRRNVGIIAHIDAGKTTTTEAILYLTGLKHKIGAVHEGETTTDWMKQERERGITITSAAVTCFWRDHQINIIDTPGHIDFTVEVERSLRVLDGAVVVFDGKMGVEAQTETVWRQADKYRVPRVCFINKINQTGADFAKSLASIRAKLSPNSYPVHLPIGFEQDVSGLVDIVEGKAYRYDDYTDQKLTEIPIPESLKAEVEAARTELIEQAFAADETSLAKWLEGPEKLTVADIKAAIRKAVLAGDFYIVSGGDGRGVIVQKLLDLVVDYLPSPADLAGVVGHHPRTNQEQRRPVDAQADLAALAFKIASDPFVGKLCFVRVYSGSLKTGMTVINANTGNRTRIGRLVRMFADKRQEIDLVSAGDIAAVVGLKDTKTGQTLADLNAPIRLESIEFAEPPVSIAIEPATKPDQEKMSLALQRLAEEDPTFRVSVDEETNQTIVSAMGELYLEVIVDRLKQEFKVSANVGRPQVAYRETIKKDQVEAQGKFIRQTGGRGQYGDVWLRLSPNQPGTGFSFSSKIRGGSVPSEYFNAVKAGIAEAMSRGVVAGYPMVDIDVVLYDGSYHDVDSSELAFKIAGSIAFQSAAKAAEPILLEPIMRLEVITPEDFMGDVIGDLNARRGKVESMTDKPGAKVILALVPLAEMFGYVNDLRSLTQGRANSTMELENYQEVPAAIVETIATKKRVRTA